MGIEYVTNPLRFLLEVVIGAYVLCVLLRFLLQTVRADFYNPISRFLVKVTNPPLVPLRRFIPGIGGIDWAAVVLMLALLSLEQALFGLFSGVMPTWWALPVWALHNLLQLGLNVYLFSIFIIVILSWVNPSSYNPAVSLLQSLTFPILSRAQRLLPPISGLDLSPMVALVGIMLLKMLLLPPLAAIARQGFMVAGN